ncbi:MAG: phenylalanine--tRNA ligase subunit beta, partial [Gammaproteobacteria bacterium]|nr:phenylalanine--tRNA ligase subunit beta [Gammaproteobacteria bacterium]
MIVSESWLRTWISPRLDTQGLVEVLTMAGLEVDSVSRAGPDLPRVVVGKVSAVTPHPRADRLRVCEVLVGGKKPLTIVCGAPNVRVGANVPTALPGAKLPAGGGIRANDVRGVRSEGMLCSAAELDLEESSAGLLLLDPDSKPGTAI